MNAARRAHRLDMIQLTSAGARALIWLYFATMVVLATWTAGGVRTPWLIVPSLLLFAAVCVALSLDTGDRLSLPVTVFVAAAAPLNALLSWDLVSPGYQQWYVGAATVSLFFVSLRGRIGLAWAGFAGMGIVLCIWGATTEIGFVTALVMTAKQAPILLVGTLFARGLRRTGNEIERLAAQENSRASAEAGASAATAERTRRLTELDAFATPLLRKIGDGTATTSRDRMNFALAEAALRDSLRARSLTIPRVVEAAREARLRGVEVVLLDDSGGEGITAEELDRAIAVLTAMLDQSKSGRVTARLLPPGRDHVATVVMDGDHYARHEVARTP